MEAATVDPVAEEREREEEEAARPISFRSRDQRRRLVIKPKRNKLDSEGNIVVTEGKVAEFAPEGFGLGGILKVDRDDGEVLKFLREHQGYGTDFVEVGNEPDRPPDPSDRLNAIVEAVVDGDTDLLKQIYLAERSSTSRPEVLKAAAKGIERLDESVPEPPETPAHQLMRYRDPAVQTAPDAPVEPVDGDPVGDHPQTPVAPDSPDAPNVAPAGTALPNAGQPGTEPSEVVQPPPPVEPGRNPEVDRDETPAPAPPEQKPAE